MPHRKQKELGQVSDADIALFRHTASVTKRLPNSGPAPNTRQRISTTSESVGAVSNTDPTDGVIDLGGDLFYRSGVQKKTLRNLKRGRPVPNAEIDLHGCTRRKALDYLQTFFSECEWEKRHCVRVVTGKGRNSPDQHSVIREITLAWLRQNPQVLAYCMTPSREGGSGAFYVLLSR